MHDLLPTQTRQHRLSPRLTPSPVCARCEEGTEGSLLHELVSCGLVAEVGAWLLNCLRQNLNSPQLTADQLRSAQINSDQLISSDQLRVAQIR